MEDKKVAIIMSTYNGEKYICEQLDSLINQTYKNIDIYIRDDGSNDNTISILDEYKKKYNNIFLIKGNNIGFVKSFYCILKYADGYDYYAFCDQDDKWHTEKIENSIKKIDIIKSDKPICVFTEYNYCDESLHYIGKSKLCNGSMTFRNALVENIISGNTSFFNNRLREKILLFDSNDIYIHDWLLYMVSAGIGELVYDENASLEYRRIDSSVSPCGKNIVKILVYRIKKFLSGDYLKILKKQIIEYNRLFGNELSEDNKKIIKLFINEKYNLKCQIKKVFYPHRFRQKLIDEIFLRFIFFIGKL